MAHNAPPSLLLDPALLSPSDLVVRLPRPEVARPTYHFDDQRFFHQARYVHDQVGDAIYITGSNYPERDRSVNFSNVYALYEVEHWPNAAAQADYTYWVIDTIINLQEGKGLPPMTPAVRKIVKACVQEGASGNYCWLYRLLPELPTMINRATMAYRVGRNPIKIRIEGPADAINSPMRRISYQADRYTAIANIVDDFMPRELVQETVDYAGKLERPILLLVGPENTRMTIDDPVIRQKAYMARTLHRCRPEYFNNWLAVMGQNQFGELVPAREEQGFYSQEAWHELTVSNRPWTSFAAQLPNKINLSDLDDQDLTELDALDDKLAARAAGLASVPRGGKRVIAPTITTVRATGSSVLQQGGPRLIEPAATYIQVAGSTMEEEVGNLFTSATLANSAASSAPVVPGSGLVQQSGNSFTSAAPMRLTVPLVLAAPGPLSSQQVSNSSTSATPATSPDPSTSTPAVTGPRLPQPSTPLQRSTAASPEAPDTDDTVQLLSSPDSASPVAHGTAAPLDTTTPGDLGTVPTLHPTSAARASRARSPSKIPRNQKPPKTFGEVEAAAATATTAASSRTGTKRKRTYIPGRTGRGKAAAQRAIPIPVAVRQATSETSTPPAAAASAGRVEAPVPPAQSDARPARPIDEFPPPPPADGRLQVQFADPYAQQRPSFSQAPGAAGSAFQSGWGRADVQIRYQQVQQQQQQGYIPFSLPYQQCPPAVAPVVQASGEAERAMLRDLSREVGAARAGLQSWVLDPRLFDGEMRDDEDGE